MAALLVILLTPRLISELRLRSRARHDYRIARGTQHLRQLKTPLSKLERDIRATQDEIRTTKRELDDLKSRRTDYLRQALCRHLVNHRLTEVDGIGPRLSKRIVRHCFRGDLHDLRYAERVSRVGPARQSAIVRWVRARESELPRLTKGPFPGKEGVEEKYRAKMAPLERRLCRARTELEEKEAGIVSKLKSSSTMAS